MIRAARDVMGAARDSRVLVFGFSAGFGRTPVERWPVAEDMYRAAGMNAVFKLYGDVGHDVPDAMDADVITFFAGALAEPSPRAK